MSKALDVLLLPFVLVMLSLEMTLTLAAMSLAALRLTVNGVPWKFGFLCLLEAIDLSCEYLKRHPAPKERHDGPSAV